MTCCYSILKCFGYLAIVIALVALAPGLPPYGVEFKAYAPEKVELQGAWAMNDRLDVAEFLPTEVPGSQFGSIEVGSVQMNAKAYYSKHISFRAQKPWKYMMDTSTPQ